ncbi:DUF4099 domain-containing protein [Mucilaginibacter polytrichastri]|uniref:DUF4099 domain-containing protein n=1 Tax=Mucilaginibacter polytrichastri TaxID=1302689 RepID=A0A1Q5ZY56_9SPHI|nr:DUF4099 domain-containing protein [Mucilaginibacter polytrichastri]OKS86672.1 hypothetical protein RG47T_2129 [Mucilaginibacter polytrichastri]SFS81974.1 Protein of unknown function [Mucilaginibacter polytrichastri]
MNLIRYNEKDLPMKELETIGLAEKGQLLINVNDLKALLSGRRTGLLNLKNLEAENIKIKALDAKISLQPAGNGKTELLVHPIYRKPATPDFLEDFEAKELEKGEVASLLKVTKDRKGDTKEVLVEYDPETREFIISDTEKVMAPDMINGEKLTPAQKENYRKGKEVALTDDTKLNYSGKDVNGIRSNKLALIASIIIDGGISYMLYTGLNAMFGEKHDETTAKSLSKGYYNTVLEMEDQRPDFSDNLRKAKPVISR